MYRTLGELYDKLEELRVATAAQEAAEQNCNAVCQTGVSQIVVDHAYGVLRRQQATVDNLRAIEIDSSWMNEEG